MATKKQDVLKRANGRRILAGMAREVDKIRARKIMAVKREYASKTQPASKLKQGINEGRYCRECLDECQGMPSGTKYVCASCTRQLRWEEMRDEQYEAEYED